MKGEGKTKKGSLSRASEFVRKRTRSSERGKSRFIAAESRRSVCKGHENTSSPLRAPACRAFLHWHRGGRPLHGPEDTRRGAGIVAPGNSGYKYARGVGHDLVQHPG